MTDHYHATAAKRLYPGLTRYEKCFGSRPAYFKEYKNAWAEPIGANGSDP
jgi:hypothetical protein